MIQHFETVSVKIPQPKFLIGTCIVIEDNHGIITGTSFGDLNQHPEHASCKGWWYQVSYSSDSPKWELWCGEEWFPEALIEEALA